MGAHMCFAIPRDEGTCTSDVGEHGTGVRMPFVITGVGGSYTPVLMGLSWGWDTHVPCYHW